MHEYVLEAHLVSLGEELVEVVQRRVDAAVRTEAEEVEFLAALLYIIVGSLDLGVLHQLVLAAGDVDLHQVLIYDAAGAEVHMSDLGVAHLAVRQAHVLAAGLEVRHWIFCAEAIDKRSPLAIDDI